MAWRVISGGALRLAKLAALVAGIVLLTIIGVRAVDSLRGPPLEAWHTFVPHELSADELDGADFVQYLAAEARAFAETRTAVTRRLDPEHRVPVNRYFEGSPIYPKQFATDWNRTFVLQPAEPPRGVAVLVHGLTDAPYSLRHVAQLYAAQGFIAIGLRVPGHGTVPGALTASTWQQWGAAVRLAVREAARRGPGLPLHIVGYSNGGALALAYALDALDDPKAPRAARIVLLSPMVGVTAFARFVGLAGIPAFFPAFAKAAWLAILPEFNPFKYNSFPVNAARQSFLLTQVVQEKLRAAARSGALARLAPVLTFQSVLDSTVLTSAVVRDLHAVLPAGESEVVLFDINRSARVQSLINTASETVLARLLPPLPRAFRTTVITNRAPTDAQVEMRTADPGAKTERVMPLPGLSYPPDVYSLSHIAVPFPVTDGLYGTMPDPADDFGVRLGDVADRGETGALIIGLDTLMRMSSNPFFPVMEARIKAAIAADAPAPR